MKILWITTRLIIEEKERESGTWLKALANYLLASGKVALGNVSTKSGIKELTEIKYKNLIQYAIPYQKVNRKGYPGKETKDYLLKVINIFQPDIIQVWGSENPFKLLPFTLKVNAEIVLCMQGVLSSMGPNCLRGMTIYEMLSTIGIREVILGNSIFTETISFYKLARLEAEMIRKSKYIITQSEWTDSQVLPINPNAKLFKTRRVLRSDFYTCKKWESFEHQEPVIFTSAYGYSLKGLHIFFKAMAIVVSKYPKVKIIIAGRTGRTDILGRGYLRMLINYSKKHNFYKNVVWAGGLSASELVKILQEASVYVNPSYVESFSVASAEAMLVGTPSVISFAGAMPERAVNNVEALYFTPGDYKQCAYKVIKLIENHELAIEISKNAVTRAKKDYDPKLISDEQIEIYKEILKK